MSMNEIDPRLMQQAHLLGQNRTPTKAEQRDIEKSSIAMAIMNVAGTALTSLLEGGESVESATQTSLNVAVAILEKSEATSEDFGDNISKRKVRNKLAAQIIYSSLRGDATRIFTPDTISELLSESFDAATKLIEDAMEFAEKEVVKNEEATAATPSS